MTFLLPAFISLATILPVAVFLAIAIGVWVFSDYFFNSTSRSDERLEQLKSRATGKTTSSIADLTNDKEREGFAKMLEKASPTLGDTLKPKSEKEINKQRDCLLYTSPSPRDRTRSRMPSSA